MYYGIIFEPPGGKIGSAVNNSVYCSQFSVDLGATSLTILIENFVPA